jgi:hypothetical protein
LLLVFAKVSLECLLTPRAVDRVGDRGECGDGLVHARVLEELSLMVSEVLWNRFTVDQPMSMRRDRPCCAL